MRTLNVTEKLSALSRFLHLDVWSPVLNLWLHPGPPTQDPGCTATPNTHECEQTMASSSCNVFCAICVSEVVCVCELRCRSDPSVSSALFSSHCTQATVQGGGREGLCRTPSRPSCSAGDVTRHPPPVYMQLLPPRGPQPSWEAPSAQSPALPSWGALL